MPTGYAELVKDSEHSTWTLPNWNWTWCTTKRWFIFHSKQGQKHMFILLRWKRLSRNLLSSDTNFSPEMSTVRMVEGWFEDCKVDRHMFKLLLSKQTPGKWLDHWKHQSGPYKTTWRLLHLCKASKERHKWRATFNRQSMPQGMLRWQEHVL